MIILVEDTYGIDFHRSIIHRLYGKNQLRGLSIKRIPAKECNPSIARKVKAMLLDKDRSAWKVLIVVDSEGRRPEYVAKRVMEHFEGDKDQYLKVKVTVINPCHEAWLCIGLGIGRAACRSDPKAAIERISNTIYSKRYLAQWAEKMDISRLEKEGDFRKYRELLDQLIIDP